MSRYQQCLRNSVLPRTRAEMFEVENILEAKKRLNEKEEELVKANENIRKAGELKKLLKRVKVNLTRPLLSSMIRRCSPRCRTYCRGW